MKYKNQPYRAPALLVALTALTTTLHFTAASAVTPDTNFRPPGFAVPSPAERVLVRPDGKYFLFYKMDTLTDRRTGAIARFLPDGTLDASFNFSRDYAVVHAAALAPNGKLYVATRKPYILGFQLPDQILLLNSDGSIDPNFHSSFAGVRDTDLGVLKILVQPDGRILVAGSFVGFGGGSYHGIVRLLSDGHVDSSFSPLDNFDAAVRAVALQPDGKILIGGDFAFIGAMEFPGVARLNDDGSVDTTFQPAGFTPSHSPIRALAVQNDGKILIGGRLDLDQGGALIVHVPLFRMNADGTADAGFTPVSTIPGAPNGRDIVVQADGKIVVAVDSSVYRFNTSGALDNGFHHAVVQDTSFDPAGSPGATVNLNLLSDGRFLVGGAFTDVDPAGAAGTSHFGVVRLNANGTVDSSFITSHKTGYAKSPSSFLRLADGSTLIGFDTAPVPVDPASAFNIGRLLPTGSLDPNFTLAPFSNNFLGGGFLASGFTPASDGSLFIFGRKTDQSFHVGKISTDGLVQSGFADDPLVPAFEKLTAVPGGKVLLAAGTDPQATVMATLTQLATDGHLDGTFQIPESIRSKQVIRGFEGNVTGLFVGSRVLAVEPDGKILFEYFDNEFHFRLVRLNSDGSIDTSFSNSIGLVTDASQDFPVIYDPIKNQTLQPVDGSYSATFSWLAAHIQDDGRIVLAGHFRSFRNPATSTFVPAPGIIRLMRDGSIDPSFVPGDGAQWTSASQGLDYFPKVENIARQGDGRLLITGTFEAFNNVDAPGIASLNPNGSVDTSFVPPATRDKFAPGETSLERQSDGTFLLSGPYTLPG